jgi:alkylhydroperoxidase family enzyme
VPPSSKYPQNHPLTSTKTPVLKEIFAKERELFGGLLNTTKVFAHCPPILKAAKQLSVSIEKSGQLPASLLPLTYLRVALINGCPF